MSSAARVPASSKLADKRRVTLRCSGVVEGGVDASAGDEYDRVELRRVDRPGLAVAVLILGCQARDAS